MASKPKKEKGPKKEIAEIESDLALPPPTPPPIRVDGQSVVVNPGPEFVAEFRGASYVLAHGETSIPYEAADHFCGVGNSGGSLSIRGVRKVYANDNPKAPFNDAYRGDGVRDFERFYEKNYDRFQPPASEK